MKKIYLPLIMATLLTVNPLLSQERGKKISDYGVKIGIFKSGKENAITDVPGVTVGHKTVIEGEEILTGVTAIIPHQGNLFKKKVPAAIYIGNGFGKLAGYSQVKELGNIETPIILTNTLSVSVGLEALIEYTFQNSENDKVLSVNGVVGETNDGGLSNIRARAVTVEHCMEALNNAKSGPVEEGAVGAGTGTITFGYKGGIGTASRVLPPSRGGYTVGVLVQSNYGGVLEIAGVQIGQLLNNFSFKKDIDSYSDGSCMMVVITDAPLCSRNLERVAKRAMLGLAKTGGIASNGSGDYVIALSVAPENLIDESDSHYSPKVLHNNNVSSLFMATIEATEEALLNSLFASGDTKGYKGKEVPGLPIKEVLKALKKAGRISK